MRGKDKEPRKTDKYTGRRSRITLTPEQQNIIDKLEYEIRNDPDIKKISERTIAEYKRLAGYVLTEKLKVTTGNKYQARSVVLYLQEYELLPKDVKIPKALFNKSSRRKGSKEAKTVEKVKILSYEDFEKLLSYFTNDDRGNELRLLCRLSFYTGCRLNEAIQVTHEMFFKDGDTWYIRLPKKITKGSKERDAVVFEEFAPYLEELKALGAFSITKAYASYEFQKARDAMNKEEWTFHCLRHSYATHGLERGIDTGVMAKMLGHSSLDITKIYDHADIKNNRTRQAAKVQPELV